MSRIQAEGTKRRVRGLAARFLRWSFGDTRAYALAKHLTNKIEARIIVRRLSASSTREHRQLACRLTAAISRNDEQMASAISTHVRQEPDRRTEKIISHRYRFMWICNPKVASRSMIRALLTIDPEAVLIRGMTVEHVLSVYPKARAYYSFAFVRDPCGRARSFVADKLVVRPNNEWTGDDRFFGMRKGMSFAEYCQWLDTPFGSDVFAERHWLSQSKQILINGELPDYVGSYENLEANWRSVLTHLRMPYRSLPSLNTTSASVGHMDDDSIAILHRRYVDDFDLVSRVGTEGLTRRGSSTRGGLRVLPEPSDEA